MENLEGFVPIIGYDGIYEINRLGQVKSIAGIGAKSVRKEKCLKNYIIGRKYYCIYLSEKGITKNHKIHRLIAQTFIPNPNNYPIINHINGIKTDNRIENLEWCTHSENIQHAYRTGLKMGSGKIKVYCSETGKEWDSIKECSKDMGIKSTSLNMYLSGKIRNKTTIKKHP